MKKLTLQSARKLTHGALLTAALTAGSAGSAAAQSAATWPTPDFGRAYPVRDVAPRAMETKSVMPQLGAMLDVGLPDGVMGGLSYRPQPWLRLQAGAGSNAVSPGLRGGVVFVPLGVGPSLTLEAGFRIRVPAKSPGPPGPSKVEGPSEKPRFSFSEAVDCQLQTPDGRGLCPRPWVSY